MAQRGNDMAVLVNRLLAVTDPRSLSIGELNGLVNSFDVCWTSFPEVMRHIRGFTVTRSEYEAILVYKIGLAAIPRGHVAGQQDMFDVEAVAS